MQVHSRFDLRQISTLSVAGYLAWATIAFGVWRVAGDWAPLGGVPGRGIAAAMLGLLPGRLVLLTTSVEPVGRAIRYVTLGLLIASTFGVMWGGPSGLSPILLIIVPWRSPGIPGRLRVAGIAAPQCLFLHRAPVALARRRRVVRSAGLWQFPGVLGRDDRCPRPGRSGSRRTASGDAGLLATRALLAESARDAERLRVSRELHDVAGHRLTALKLNLDVLGLDASLATRREVVVAQQLTAELLSDVRSVVSRLRHDDGLDISEALRRIAEPFPRPAIHVDVPAGARVEGAERADALVRACQEALTNAVRHAEATNIWITLVQRGPGVELVIRDDGSYAGSHVQGFGLKGMRERVEQVGGSVATARSAGGGFEVTVRLAGANA